MVKILSAIICLMVAVATNVQATGYGTQKDSVLVELPQQPSYSSGWQSSSSYGQSEPVYEEPQHSSSYVEEPEPVYEDSYSRPTRHYYSKPKKSYHQQQHYQHQHSYQYQQSYHKPEPKPKVIVKVVKQPVIKVVKVVEKVPVPVYKEPEKVVVWKQPIIHVHKQQQPVYKKQYKKVWTSSGGYGGGYGGHGGYGGGGGGGGGGYGGGGGGGGGYW